ncbi:MAG: hypothetical protein CLLPBCKN_002939 [Chroococcidiopsis cubana SAG 39.79]|uniref:Uncharacterized protein n=1 Tax=Chroococcidiopsis cubana SAG 39.79 TaxID=388085 RepID=A0AB37UK44_9CYAN|nr:hypothetical protein [Chroococcidiopsis cubana]MDZ4873543.1 hypothetical protein [Chroococcidiopsis cubana SAG 39.79]PSB52521.1 hypothetical protein C7B79_35865 [Chroococcidiopsis cubana CCALA 043]RUT11728.1 hypothetical protein DSM107010_29050 [Chroococcidiopsis cubana SAG 39.79]
MLAFTGIGLVPLLLAGGAAAAIGSFIFGGPSEEELHYKAKQQVYDLGFKKFNESAEEIFNKIEENIASVFYNRVEQAEQVIEQLISSHENILEQQNKVHKETLEQREAEKAFISQQRRKLEQLQNEIDAILSQCVG